VRLFDNEASAVKCSRRMFADDDMGDDADLLASPKFRMWLRPDGIVQLVWAPKTTVLVEDATAALEAMAQLTGGRRSPLLVDMHDTGSLDRPTRTEFTRRVTCKRPPP